MEKLKQKLSSRKLWAAVIAVIVVLAVSLFGEELTPETVSALECVVGAAVAYIFGEGAVDIARIIAEAVKRAYTAAYEVVGEDFEKLQNDGTNPEHIVSNTSEEPGSVTPVESQ